MASRRLLIFTFSFPKKCPPGRGLAGKPCRRLPATVRLPGAIRPPAPRYPQSGFPLEKLPCCCGAASGKFRKGGLGGGGTHVRDRLQVRRVSDLPPGSG